MKSYSPRGKGKPFQTADYRISRGRRVVENAFGILSSRFRVLSDTILVHLKRVKDTVLACVVLHNMLRTESGSGGARDLEDEEIFCGLEEGDDGDGHNRNPTNTAKGQRDHLKDWFNGAGAVPWQDGKV